MTLQAIPQVIVLCLAGSTAAMVSIHAWRRRGAPGVTGLALALACLAAWAFGSALELSSALLDAKIAWAKVQYFAVLFLPVSWLVFALPYSGQSGRMTRRMLGFLAVEPVVTALLVLTNEAHGIVWRGITLDVSGSVPVLKASVGAWHRAHGAYSLFLLLIGSYALLRALVTAPQIYRRKGLALLFTALAPWAGVVLFLFGRDLSSTLDPAPFVFTLTGLALTWGLLHLQSVDLLPAARDAVIENLHDALIVLDARLGIVDLNPAAEEMIGLPASKVVRRTADTLFHDNPEIQELLRSPDQETTETILRWDDVEHRCELRLTRLYDKQQRLCGRVLALHDVTAFALAEERYSNLFLQSKDAVVIHDANGDIIDVNQKTLEQFGYKRSEILLLNITALYPPAAEETWGRSLEETLEEGFASFEVEFRRKEGAIFPAEVRSSLIQVGDERIVQVIVRDMTERKRVEEEWKRAKEAAEAANFAKTRFLANMSHEIRTPMNAIMGMTELVLETQLTQKQRRFLNTVESSADSLMSLIDDILDASKIEAGKLDFAPVEFNLRDCLEDCIGVLAIQAREKSLRLACDLDDDVPKRVVADPGRLRQIVVNLVGNGIKFTDTGEVRIHVGTERKTDEHAWLHFEISDTGVGIPPEQFESIFDPFTQADSSTTRQHGGTGLGLAITSQLVELMDGKIWVESELGKGSVFHFIAVLGLHEPTATPTLATETDLQGMRALVVDDNPANRLLFEEMLARFGMEPLTTSSAKDALEELKRASDERRPYGLVILDMHMPVMDGFELAAGIKQTPEIADVTLMMLTSGGERGDAARCRESGIAAYLRKPIATTTMREAILMSLPSEASADMPVRLVTRHSIRETKRPVRILLADDNPVNQEMTVFMLEGSGHRVEVVGNGREAVTALQGDHEFDVVLMDAEMPEMDGLEATRVIREREKGTGEHIPIVAMTAHVMKGDRQRCLRAGMDGFLAKPVKRDRLFDALAAAAEGERGFGDHPGSDDEMTEMMDVEEALARMKGRHKLLARAASVFLEDYPKVTRRMRECISGGDPEGVRKAAHRLKGSVGAFAARRAWETAQRLETSARDGNLEEAEELFALLEEELEQLKPALEDFRMRADDTAEIVNER